MFQLSDACEDAVHVTPLSVLYIIPVLPPATSVPSDKTAGVFQLPDVLEDAVHVTPLSVLDIIPAAPL